jgi:Flp pilus assembly protein TadD
VLGIITIQYQHGRAIGAETILVGGVASRIATAGMAILFYLKQIVWPVNLLPIYPRWEVDPPKVWQFLAWPVIAAATAWLWANRGTADRPGWGRHALFGLGFFLLMVLPVLGFVTISYMRITWVADHFIYLPMIGVIALIGAATTRWYERSTPSAQPLILAGGAILLATCGLLAFRYANAWASEDALWTHTLKTNHNAWQAHNRLGAKKFSRGDIEGGFYHFTQSTRLRPDLGETHNNLGSALSAKGRLDEAIKEFAVACQMTPHVPAMRVNLANALFQAGRFVEASDAFLFLLEREPNNAALLNNYAVTLYRQGNKDEAILQFRKALEINPTLKDAREGLAVALGEQPAAPPPGRPLQAEQPLQPQQAPTMPAQSTLGPPPFSSPTPTGKAFDPLGIQGK